MKDKEAKELGLRLGEIIGQLLDLIADIDGTTRDEVMEAIFAGWLAERLSEQR